MQSLTIPASISKRKQACQSCRSRKKRCDAERPTCSLCKKWGLRCEYGASSSEKPSNDRPTIRHPGSMQSILPAFATDVNDTPPMMDPPHAALTTPPSSTFDQGIFGCGTVYQTYRTPDSNFDVAADKVIDLDQILINAPLPCDPMIIQLVELFFENMYDVFPCFHKKSFMAQIENRYLQTKAPMILYAICCVAARLHPSPAIQNRQAEWFEQAKFCYELTQRTPLAALRTIQAALLLVVHASSVGDFSSSWLCLGKAWRQAVALGMNRMDIGQPATANKYCLDMNPNQEKWYGLEKVVGKTSAEREEYRRTLWLLFFLDRNHSWPTGWPNAIPERQFKVDIPIAESIFQAIEPETDNNDHTNTTFTRNINTLIATSSAAKDPLNLFHYLAISHVLLGRITDLVHSLHDAPHTPEYAEECEELDAYVIKFGLTLPSAATTVLGANPKDRQHVLYLNLQLNTMTILLHFRHTNSEFPCTDPRSPYRIVVTAARNTLQIVKDASRISRDLLFYPHLGGSLYIAACVLVIEWRLTNDDTLKEDVEMFQLVFDRMYETIGFLGLKFKLALEHDVRRSKEEIMALRQQGFKGLLADCTKWDYVKQAVEGMGGNFFIT